MLDAGAFHRLNIAIRDAILRHESGSHINDNGKKAGSESSFEECALTVTPEIRAHVHRVQRQWNATVAFPTEYANYTSVSLGSTSLRAHSCAPKSGYQIIIQLASLFYFGYHPPCLEVVSLRSFRNGRVDSIQHT